MTFRTRFAPSPTGPLHLGHAYSALLAYDMARDAGGTFLLRIEDIDGTRAKSAWEDQIYRDLEWLGISWRDPVMRQSERLDIYKEHINDLWHRHLAFACSCTRRDISQALSAPQEGVPPVFGPDGAIYPGTCRGNVHTENQPDIPQDSAVRLRMQSAMQALAAEGTLEFLEMGAGPSGETGKITFSTQDLDQTIGDIVLARRDMGTSYHLSVVLDDAAQGITHTVRGADLFEATKIHVVLQHLLGLPTPIYHHHRLIRDDQGKRLAKRDDARAISLYRDQGAGPDDIRALVGLPRR